VAELTPGEITEAAVLQAMAHGAGEVANV